MKKLLFVLLVAPLLQGCDKPSNGRFQIVVGAYDSPVVSDNITNSRSVLEHGVFKIDTQTGRTWTFFSGMVIATNLTPAYVEGWREVK